MATTPNTISFIPSYALSIFEGESVQLDRLAGVFDVEGDILRWTLSSVIATDPMTGAVLGNSSLNDVSINADGRFTFRALLDLADGQYRTETFNFTVYDGTAYSITSIQVTLAGSGTTVQAPDDYGTTSSGQPITLNVLANDGGIFPDGTRSPTSVTSINGQLLSDNAPVTVYSPTTGFAIGIVSKSGTEALQFSPADGFTGKASFSYGGIYQYGNESDVGEIPYTQQVFVEVLPALIPAPNGVADIYTLPLIPIFSIGTLQGVLVNDLAPSGGGIGAQLVSGPSQGTLDFNADGSFTYQASAEMLASAPGTNHQVTFTYRASNGSAEDADTTLVTLNLRQPTGAPVAVNDVLNGTEDRPLVITPQSLFGEDGAGPQNDSQAEGQAFTEIRIQRLPGTGTLLLDGVAVNVSAPISVAQLEAGKLVFVPLENYSGSTSFDYIVRSNDGFSDPATVTLAIAATPDGAALVSPPVEPLIFIEAADATAQVLSAPLGQLQFLDPDSPSLSASFSTLVVPSNPAIVVPPTVITALESAISLTQASTPSGSGTLLTISPVSPTFNVGPLNLDFLPAGEDLTLIHRIIVADDTGARSAGYDIEVLITGTNDAPVAYLDQIGPVLAGGSTQFTDQVLLANDIDLDNGETELLELATFGFGSTVVAMPLTGSTTLAGTYGELTINANGQLSYAATTDESTSLIKGVQVSDTFIYTITDPYGATSESALIVSVTGANRAPTSAADSYTLSYGQALTVSASSGVLNNDSDSDGDPLSAILQIGPSNGSLTLNANGSFTYTPSVGFSGTDSFSYLASDGSASSASTQVSITVQPPPLTLALDKKVFINEIAVNTGAATITINTNNGALPDRVTTGVGRVELFNFSSSSISATDLAKANLEVVGLNAKLSVIGLDHLTGLTETAAGAPLSGVALQANGSLVLYEPNAGGIGIWQTYSASGTLLLSGTYQDNSWGLGTSVSSPIAINLVEQGRSIDFFAANGAPLSGLTDSGSTQTSLSSIASLASGAHAQGSITPFQLPDLSSPWFGNAQLSPSGAVIPNDVLSLLSQNAQFSGLLASPSDTVFARSYDHYLAATGGRDAAFVDYNDAGDWTYGGRAILTVGRENVLLSRSTPQFVANEQDAADDANPLQGYQPASDLIAGISNESGQTIAIYAGFGEGGRGHDFLYGIATDDVLAGNGGNDYLYGSDGNDRLEGGNGADWLMGGTGNDRLLGGSGSDSLMGGAGRDRLNGGSGTDTFIFRNLSHSTLAASDIIEDFVKGIDKIDLSAIDANARRAGDQAFVFAGRSASAAPNALNWFESSGNTVVQLDVDGNRSADMQIVLVGTNLGLTAADFVL